MKKGFRYVLLALCCLALVFQPVISFADDLSYNFETLGRFIYLLQTAYYPDNVMSAAELGAYYDITGHYAYYQTGPNTYPYSYLQSASGNIANASNCVFYHVGNYYYLYYPDPNSVTLQLYAPSTSTSIFTYNGNTNTQTAVRYFLYNSGTNSYSSGTSSSLQQISSSTMLFISSELTDTNGNNIFTIINNGNSEFPDISDLTGSTTSIPSSLQTPRLSPLLVTIANKLNSEFPNQVPSGGSTDLLWYNTYEDGALWELINANTAILETYMAHNYGFFNNISSNLATFANNQTEISEYVSSIIPDVSEIQSNLEDINLRLETAFPSDQAALNDGIAAELLDDSNGTGLTVSKITSAKSDLDDGIDTFEVDITGIAWSNPFTALLNLDWAWFSQTTAQNLQSLDSGSLQGNLDYSDLPYYNSVNSYYDDGN